MIDWNPAAYGADIARLLALDAGGNRLLPLTAEACSDENARRAIARRGAKEWFPKARARDAALAGLYLYFSCAGEAHEVAQSIDTPDGSYWHAIVHRQEPDPANARYWFGRTGKHPVFALLREQAVAIAAAHSGHSWAPPKTWDPGAFIELCEAASRQRGSKLEQVALEIQRAEWRLLFDHCARSVE
jgi:hypothetical protein